MTIHQSSQPTTIEQAIKAATQHIKETQNTNAKLEAEILLAKVLNKPRAYIYTWPEQRIENEEFQQFESLVHRRCAGEPIAYITGFQEFWGLPLKVTPDTLIPRPETERLVEIALDYIPEKEPWRIADLGTGSGAIALAIADERPDVVISATDASETTLKIAKINRSTLNLPNVNFYLGHWFEAFKNQPDDARTFHLIISNPPYVAENDPHLQQGDLRFEPSRALSSGTEGLDDICEIIQHAKDHLINGGHLLIEHGFDQADAVIDLFDKSGYSEVKCFRDYAERERATIGSWLK